MAGSLYGPEEEQREIWVFLEEEDGVLEGVSLELLSKARYLADEAGWALTGLLMCHEAATLPEEAIRHGADRVLLADHPLLESFTVDAFADVAFQVLLEKKPSVLLLGATPNGRDLAGRLAVRLRTGLTADCTDLRLDVERGVLVSEVSGFGGGILALIETQDRRPQMATVRPGVFVPEEVDPKRTGEIIPFLVELRPEAIRTRILERVRGERVDLTQAPALVVGGRGLDGQFGMLWELAGLLGGEVGASRPAVDEGHIERERQIGQTGVACRPKVAIVCGVSGAFHFMVGLQEADVVIAINSDPEAPIFQHADYCVVGDVFEVVPALVGALRTVGVVTYA